MASKAFASATLLFSLNLLFFTLVTSSYASYAPPSPKSDEHDDLTKPLTSPPNSYGNHGSTESVQVHPIDDENHNYPMPQSPAKPSKYCPKNALNLGECANVLKKLLKLDVGEPSKMPCCSLIQDFVDIDAAVCLCTAIKANVLDIKLDVPLSLELLLNYCGKEVPHGFLCA